MSKRTPLTYIAILALFIVIYNFFFKSAPIRNEFQAQVTNKGQSSSPNSQRVAGAGIPTAQEYADMVARANKATNEKMPDFGKVTEFYNKQSAEVLAKFSTAAKIQFQAPVKMNFRNLDLQDDALVGTYGTSGDLKTGLAVVASELRPTDQMVGSFLRESAAEIPSLSKKDISWSEEPKSFPAPKFSGLLDAKVWVGEDTRGNSYAAAMLPRSDGRGSYLFIYNSPGKQMFENDDYFEKLFSEIKVSP